MVDNEAKKYDSEVQSARDEYNEVDNRRIIAVGELNAAYSDMMYANSMLDSLSNRSPSQVMPGAVDYWRGRSNEARDRYNRYTAEIPMIEAELASARGELKRREATMRGLISQRNLAAMYESYHQTMSEAAQDEIDRIQRLIDAALPDLSPNCDFCRDNSTLCPNAANH